MAKNILVVEDDQKIARVLELQLSHAGYKLHLVSNGNEVERVFFNGKFDLIILDVMLPGLNGLEICHRIRKKVLCRLLCLQQKAKSLIKLLVWILGPMIILRNRSKWKNY